MLTDWDITKSGDVDIEEKNGPDEPGAYAVGVDSGYVILSLKEARHPYLYKIQESEISCDCYFSGFGDHANQLLLMSRYNGITGYFAKIWAKNNHAFRIGLYYYDLPTSYGLVTTITLSETVLGWHSFLFRTHNLDNGNVLLTLFKKSNHLYYPVLLATDSTYKKIDEDPAKIQVYNV